MQREEMLELIDRHYATFWQGNLDDLQDQLAPDFVDDEQPNQLPGWHSVREAAQRARTAFPDMTVTRDDAIVEGRAAAVLSTWRGTHVGDHPLMASTGRPVVFQAIVIWRFDSQGRIVRRTARNIQAAITAQLMHTPSNEEAATQ